MMTPALIWLCRSLFLAILAAAPWFLGGWPTNVQFWLYGSVLIVLAIWILVSIFQAMTIGLTSTRLPLALVPLLAALGLGQFQLSPRPNAPSPISIQKSIDSSSEGASDETVRRQSGARALIHSLQTGGSIAPYATRFEMSRLMIVVVAFFLGTQLFDTPLSQRLLWTTLALNGAALSFFGIVQQFSWNGKIYWTIPLLHGGEPFSSFVNRNNAAGYLCICLAAACGFALWSFSTKVPTIAGADRLAAHHRNTRSRRRFSMSALISGIEDLTAVQLIAGTFITLISAGIVLATSRGGWLAFALGAAAAALVAFNSRSKSAFVYLSVLGLFCVGLVVWADQGNRLGRRWDQFASADAISNDGRWSHWGDALKVVRDFPWTGTGMGTYPFAYLPYQSNSKLSHLRFYNADNQFLEWLVEDGIVGLSLVAIFLLLTATATISLLRRSQVDFSDPAGVVGTFLIVSQCVSSFFDFGPTTPANMLALATLFGAITGRAAMLVDVSRFGLKRFWIASPCIRPSLMIPVFGMVLLAVGANGLKEVRAAAAAHSAYEYLPKLDSPDVLDEASVSECIDKLSKAIANYPDDADAHKALAELWIYQFRLQAFASLADQNRGLKKPEVWAMTSPAALFRQVSLWQKTGQLERIETLLENSTVQNHLPLAAAQLNKAQAANPLSPDVDHLLAALSFVDNNELRSVPGHLRRALIVAPANPEVYYLVGELGMLAGLTDFSFYCLKTSLELSPRYLLEIHKSLLGLVPLDEELENVIPKSGELIVELARFHSGKDEIEIRRDLANRAVQLLSVPLEAKREAARWYALGSAHLLLGEFDDAIHEYHRALELSPLQVQWRMELTKILQEHKGIHWALREAEIGSSLLPRQKQFQILVRDLRSKMDRRQTPSSTSKNPVR